MKFQFAALAGARRDESPKTEKILQAARRLLIRQGFSTFSARGVAKEAKVSLGALQYCYRTKQSLMTATLEYVVNRYEIGYQKVLRTAPAGGKARFLSILDYLISDVWDQDSRKLFLGLWGMSSHDPLAAELVREMYRFHAERLSDFLSEANPELPEQRRRQLAVHIVAMLEGLMLFSRRPGRTVLPRAEMTRLTRELVLKLIDFNEAD